MSSVLTKGVGFFTSNMVNSYRAAGDSILYGVKKLAACVGISEIPLKEKCQSIATAALRAAPSLIQNINDNKGDFFNSFNYVSRFDAYSINYISIALLVQTISAEFFSSMFFDNGSEIDGGFLSKFGPVTVVGMSGGIISFAAIKAMEMLRSRGDLRSSVKQIELLSSAILLSSVVTTTAGSILSQVFGSQIPGMTTQIACCSSTALMAVITKSSLAELRLALVVLFGATVTETIHHTFGLASPLIALAALAGHQLLSSKINKDSFEDSILDGAPVSRAYFPAVIALGHSTLPIGKAILAVNNFNVLGTLTAILSRWMSLKIGVSSGFAFDFLTRHPNFVGPIATFYRNIQIPRNERDDFLRQLYPFINPAIPNNVRWEYEESYLGLIADSISDLSRIPVIELDGFIAHVIQLRSPIPDPYEIMVNTRNVIETLCQIPADERTARVNRTIVQLQQDILQNLPGFDRRYRTRQLLETPLNQNLPPVGGMVEVAMAGNAAINVHAGLRDQRTIAAIALLRGKQGILDQNQINQAMEEFKNHLQTIQGITPETRERALLALEGPAANDFGSLLSDPQCGSYHISGAEVIARHWIFATTYEDPTHNEQLAQRERNNAKLGMITALSTSYTPGTRERICNEGKTQRLAISVLQGRLPGVDIDEIPALIPIVDAMAMFFAIPQHQGIETRTALLATADLYCQENPRVERLGFLAAIQNYADLQEMES